MRQDRDESGSLRELTFVAEAVKAFESRRNRVLFRNA